jgi:hypothetical protein
MRMKGRVYESEEGKLALVIRADAVELMLAVNSTFYQASRRKVLDDDPRLGCSLRCPRKGPVVSCSVSDRYVPF